MVNIKHPVIKHANSLPTEVLQSFVHQSVEIKGAHYKLQVCYASELSDELKVVIWDVYESTMRKYAEGSSFGWNPAKKRKELFHRLARYLLFWSGGASSESTLPAEALLAYCTFRFEREDKRNIVYCYELMVAPDSQGRGLGTSLIEALNCIAGHTGMTAIMLTALKVNSRALKFYDSVGFTEDVTSPGYRRDEDEWNDDGDACDYVIMSKATRAPE